MQGRGANGEISEADRLKQMIEEQKDLELKINKLKEKEYSYEKEIKTLKDDLNKI
jgi:cell shape-determining protein MreC